MENTLPIPLCPSCGHDRPDRFCPACGEERVVPDELSVRRMIAAALKESPLDSRIVRTLIALFRRPGHLTAEYIRGRREPYVRPFRMYLLISIVFFFVIPYTGLLRYTIEVYEHLSFVDHLPKRMIDAELQRTGETRESYTARFNETLAGQRKVMMLFMVPIFALGLIPIFRRRRFGEHLVFSTHYFAALLLYLGIIMQLFFKLGFVTLREMAAFAPEVARGTANLLESETTLLVFIMVPSAIYLGIAARRAYGVSVRHATAGAMFLSFWFIVSIAYFYRTPLFFTTFYSLRWFN